MRRCHHKSVEHIKGVFHGFFQEGNLEHGCDPVAIVELDNGTIECPCASGIVFEDAPQNTKELAATDSQQLNYAIAALRSALSCLPITLDMVEDIISKFTNELQQHN